MLVFLLSSSSCIYTKFNIINGILFLRHNGTLFLKDNIMHLPFNIVVSGKNKVTNSQSMNTFCVHVQQVIHGFYRDTGYTCLPHAVFFHSSACPPCRIWRHISPTPPLTHGSRSSPSQSYTACLVLASGRSSQS